MDEFNTADSFLMRAPVPEPIREHDGRTYLECLTDDAIRALREAAEASPADFPGRKEEAARAMASLRCAFKASGKMAARHAVEEAESLLVFCDSPQAIESADVIYYIRETRRWA